MAIIVPAKKPIPGKIKEPVATPAISPSVETPINPRTTKLNKNNNNNFSGTIENFKADFNAFSKSIFINIYCITSYINIGDFMENVNVQYSGFSEDLIDEFTRTQIEKLVERSTTKIGNVVKIHNFLIHLKRHKESGKRKKYSLSVKISTDGGIFTANKFGFDLVIVADKLFHAIEKEVISAIRRKEALELGIKRKSKQRF